MAEIVNLHENINDEGSAFTKFIELMGDDIVRGMFIAYKPSGEVYISCNVYNKAQQIVMLYNMHETLKDIINSFTPDEEMIEMDNEENDDNEE